MIVTGRTVGVRVREWLMNIWFFCSACHPSFLTVLLTHRCLLEHSLHVQIYIVHCASGAVAGLCFNVDRGFNAIWRHRLGKWTAEIIINLKHKWFGTNPNRDSWVNSARIRHFISPFKTSPQSQYISVPQPGKDGDNFLSFSNANSNVLYHLLKLP